MSQVWVLLAQIPGLPAIFQEFLCSSKRQEWSIQAGPEPCFSPLSSSEQSEEEGEKKKRKKRKKLPEGHGEDSSSDEGSDSSSSSSESEMTSESEEEQVEPASWKRKTVRALPVSSLPFGPDPNISCYLKQAMLFHPTHYRPGCSPSSHPQTIFLFQPPSSKSVPAAKEISLLDLEDCEFGCWKSQQGGSQGIQRHLSSESGS